MDRPRFEDLVGKTISKIENFNDERLVFTLTNGEQYQLYHYQDCCENVTIEDIVGDLDSIIGEPVWLAEEVSNVDEPPAREYEESYTWTFYKIATNHGYVTIRWYGYSNGYYSERVDWEKI